MAPQPFAIYTMQNAAGSLLDLDETLLKEINPTFDVPESSICAARWSHVDVSRPTRTKLG
jgi:hypothetical protein